MFRSDQRRIHLSEAIFGLWRNWAICGGTITLLIVLSPIVSLPVLFLLNAVCYLFLHWYKRMVSTSCVPHCNRLASQVSVIFLITMMCLCIVYMFAQYEGAKEITGQPFSMDVPMLVGLITCPVAVIVTSIFLFNKKEPLTCKRCKMCYGNVIEHSFVGDLYNREWKYQTFVLLAAGIALTIADWTYYLLSYVNTNLNRADMFFFMWLPMAMYMFTLIFLGNRYYSLWLYYCKNDEEKLVSSPASSEMRYLLINGDHIFLHFEASDQNFENGANIKRFDTPVKLRVDYHEFDNLPEAVQTFKRATGIKDAEIRSIYVSPDYVTYHNTFHYFAFIDDPDQVSDSKVTGEWMTWGNVMQLGSQHLLERDLVAELKRIYDIVMTWKTYDNRGRRLYQIKNYKPTFRLRDLRRWTVDYNDITWLKIARNNQDKFWYPLTRLFTRYDAKG